MVRLGRLFIVLGTSLALGVPSVALEDVRFRAPGASDDLEAELRSASLLLKAETRTDDIQELLATIRAEYGRLLAALYAEGHFGGVISIDVDGREASTIAPLNPPSAINRITVRVEPGPAYTFGEARIGPLASRTELPDSFAAGEIAGTKPIKEAAAAAIEGLAAGRASESRYRRTADRRPSRPQYARRLGGGRSRSARPSRAIALRR